MDLRDLLHKQIFVFITKGRFSHATDAGDFGIKGLRGCGVKEFINGRATIAGLR